MVKLTLPDGKDFYLKYSDIQVLKGTHYHTEVYHNVCGVINCTGVKELPSRVMEIIKREQHLELLND